jgi:hypothetical protein
MLRKTFVFFALSFSLSSLAAQESVLYVTQPDELTIFLNGVAYVRDEVVVAGGSDVSIALPGNLFEETLMVREGDNDVVTYTINATSGARALHLPAAETGGVRTLTLEYLASGISWQPSYRMSLSSAADDTVDFSYYAAIRNDAFELSDAAVRLAAGRVDAYQAVQATSTGLSMNQMFTDQTVVANVGLATTGSVTIQHTYDIGTLSTSPGDTTYTKILEETFSIRRILLWNAASSLDVSVIYKVLNSSAVPLTEGVVRNTSDGLFIGSDGIEFTPIGSEGSVTVGSAREMRVERAETITAISPRVFTENNQRHDVTLTLTNFGSEAVTVEVVDQYPTDAQAFVFSVAPIEEGGNILRWIVEVPAGETVTITYQFEAMY